MNDNATGPGAVERPVLANEPGDYWGSDAVALMLRELNLPRGRCRVGDDPGARRNSHET